MENKIFDAVVIGGGVIGCSVARELAAYDGRFALLERAGDVAVGTSKANSGIVHAGYDAECGTLKAKFNVAGSRAMKSLCMNLEVPYKNCGAFVLSFGNDEGLIELKTRGDTNGARVEIVSGDFVREKESAVSDNVTAALYAPDSAIVDPYELTIALKENAEANGVEFILGFAVSSVKREGGLYLITDGARVIRSRTVINAAGLFSDEISNAAIGTNYKITPRRGEYCLLDKTAQRTGSTIFQLPSASGKGVLVTPTCHGNTLVGPTAHEVPCKSATETSADGLEEAWSKASLSVPSISKRDIITQFAGLRASTEGGDFIIGEDEDGFFNAVGIDSPGLASSPAIGAHLAELVAKKLNLSENAKFEPHRAAIPSFAEASDEKRAELVASNPKYGKIICRCENVTEAEIVEAVRRGAVDLDGVKRRVRAGMGRCQAGFCTPNLMKILSRELGVSETAVTKNGRGSELVFERKKAAQSNDRKRSVKGGKV